MPLTRSDIAARSLQEGITVLLRVTELRSKWCTQLKSIASELLYEGFTREVKCDQDDDGRTIRAYRPTRETKEALDAEMQHARKWIDADWETWDHMAASELPRLPKVMEILPDYKANPWGRSPFLSHALRFFVIVSELCQCSVSA